VFFSTSVYDANNQIMLAVWNVMKSTCLCLISNMKPFFSFVILPFV
jgi:hypothetical protein